ncbi:MAG: class A beta-lactamase-related serine hydrolase [Caulobacteraceae bacterium]|nr:MAG: class A beta-lactamase-related serine hydrolase [Caulobacteraceae bacterium]
MSLKRSLLAALAVGGLLAGPVATPVLAQGRPAALAPARPESVGFSSERLAKLDATMKALVDRGAVPGVVTYVARHGKVVHQSIYGKADLATGAPLKEDTLYRMYSQTKPVTGVAMMILFEEGRWKLDEPVTKYVPEFNDLKVYKGVDAKGKPILEPIARSATMREIMSHTAGFAYGLTTDNPVDKAYRDSGLLASANLHEVMVEASKLPLASQPGEAWRYSIAVDIQGYIVEKLSGQSLPDFMESRIFKPLGMKDTAFWVPEAKRGRQASLYMVDREKGVVPAEGFMVLDVTKPPTAANGGGGLVSTLGDYARFAQMLGNGGELDGVRILSPATIKLMAANHLTDAQLAKQPLGPGVGFGLDFGVIMDPAVAGTPAGKGTFSWGGAAGTWFWVDPENDVVVLGMIQVLGGGQVLRLDELSQQLIYAALVDPSK